MASSIYDPASVLARLRKQRDETESKEARKPGALWWIRPNRDVHRDRNGRSNGRQYFAALIESYRASWLLGTCLNPSHGVSRDPAHEAGRKPAQHDAQGACSMAEFCSAGA